MGCLKKNVIDVCAAEANLQERQKLFGCLFLSTCLHIRVGSIVSRIFSFVLRHLDVVVDACSFFPHSCRKPRCSRPSFTRWVLQDLWVYGPPKVRQGATRPHPDPTRLGLAFYFGKVGRGGVGEEGRSNMK